MRTSICVAVLCLGCLCSNPILADETADEALLLDRYAAQALKCTHAYPSHTRRALAKLLHCMDEGARVQFAALRSANGDLYDMMFTRHDDIAERLKERKITWFQAAGELTLLDLQMQSEAARRAQTAIQEQAQSQERVQQQAELDRRQRAAQCAYSAYLMGGGRGSAESGAIMGDALLARCRALELPVPEAPLPSTGQAAAPQPTTTTCMPWGYGIKCHSN